MTNAPHATLKPGSGRRHGRGRCSSSRTSPSASPPRTATSLPSRSSPTRSSSARPWGSWVSPVRASPSPAWPSSACTTSAAAQDLRLDPDPRQGGHRPSGEPDAQAAWFRGRDDLPGRPRRPAPVLPRRRAAGRGLPGAPPQREQARCPPQGDRDARPGRHPAARPSGRRLPAPVLRRHASARDDRDGPDQRPVAAHRRRADDRSRRDGAGADPRPAPGPPARVQLRGHHHHPRPRRHRRDRGRRAGDVRRPVRGVRHHQADPDAPGDALHLGPALQHPRRHRQHRRAAHPHSRERRRACSTRRPGVRSTRAASTRTRCPATCARPSCPS